MIDDFLVDVLGNFGCDRGGDLNNLGCLERRKLAQYLIRTAEVLKTSPDFDFFFSSA